MKKTRYFQSARGVFQGGGVKGIALLGAYSSAIKHGVNFSAVAGTSAGALVAALAGAGAKPDFIDAEIRKIRFTDLTRSPKADAALSPTTAKSLSSLLAMWPSQKARTLSRILKFGGLYTSEAIQDLAENLLRQVLGKTQGLVKFSDLPIPTTIVAADITNNRAKFWSRETTPDAHVAFAVRCSCSIPLFFLPVSEGNVRYVDGGVLSNLPSFVFARSGSSQHGGRILAFSLQDEFKVPKTWNLEVMLKRLATTVVDGAVDIQRELVDATHEIAIDVKSIETLDFDKINDEVVDGLLAQGAACADGFFESEASQATSTRRYSDNVCWNDGDVYSVLAERELSSDDHVFVVKDGTRWFWTCFPLFLEWRRKGARVTVLAKSKSGDKKEEQRRDFLRKLGAEFVEPGPEGLPFQGFLIQGINPSLGIAAIDLDTESEDAPEATVYRGKTDGAAITGFIEKIRAVSRASATLGKVAPIELRESRNVSELIGRLRSGVLQYSSSQVNIEIQKVRIEEVLLLNRYIRADKYKRIELLHDAYTDSRIAPFAAVDIYADSRFASTITPPVLERHGNRLITIEGNTRMYFSWRAGIKEVYGLVVSGVTAPLPGKPREPATTIVDAKVHRRENRIDGFHYEQFRAIERAARPL